MEKKGEAVNLENWSVARTHKKFFFCPAYFFDAADFLEATSQCMTILTLNTFQNKNKSKATYIEFYNVVYQVAGDRMPVHLVDDHLLQKERRKEKDSYEKYKKAKKNKKTKKLHYKMLSR